MKTMFENLTDDENKIIQLCRNIGFAEYYPMFPSWENQGPNTLTGALNWLIKSKISPIVTLEAMHYRDARRGAKFLIVELKPLTNENN